MDINVIRKRISESIKESKKTQIYIAAQLGIKQATVSEYVTMKSLPALDTLSELCKLLDIDANYILGITNYAGEK